VSYSHDNGGARAPQSVEETTEKVEHPAHYGGADNVYEAIKVIEAWKLDFTVGNAVKYIARAGKKPGESELDDLEKARWYLERRLQQLKKEKTK